MSRRPRFDRDPARAARERLRMCEAKIRYGSARQARKHARTRAGGQRFRVYTCPHCHGYHVTTQPKREP